MQPYANYDWQEVNNYIKDLEEQNRMMLEALQWAFDDPDSGILGEDWATIARAAIAKATGDN